MTSDTEPAVPTSLDELDPAVAAAVGRATTIVVPVDDGSDPARARARRVATALAGLVGAKLVLLDRDDTTYADTPRVNELSRDEVAGLDRPELLALVDEAAESGVAVTAFQHSLPGAEALTDAVKATRAELVVVPTNAAAPGFLDRLKGDDLDERAADAAPVGTAVVSVGDDGSLTLVG